MTRQFYERQTFGVTPREYNLLPFRFLRMNENQEILVNEVGEYVLAPLGTAYQIVRRLLPVESDLYATLKAKQFIYDQNSAPLLDALATKYRTKKSFMEGSTKLHIFVVTLRCDHSCHYCQVSRQTSSHSEYDMSRETAQRSVTLMMESPSQHLTLEFQGGEPLLAFDMIRYVVELAEEKAAERNKILDKVVATNLANATNEMLSYFRQHNIKVSTSLDGPAFIHNSNRPRPGNNSYELTIENIGRARDVLGWKNVAALMTTTQLSLQHPIEIIDEYVRQGFHSIFLRPISPYGFAVKTKTSTGYEIGKFLGFYKAGLEHIINLNRQGVDMCEIYARILLTKILTPHGTGFVDLQSPAGAGIGVLVYNYDGDVYASDESRMLAEMKDHTFRLGNVHQDDHKRIFTSDRFAKLLDSACNESLPGCSDCAFQTYCGSDPIFNYTTQGDIVGHRPTSDFCMRNMEIIRHLVSLASTGDREINHMFWAWIRGAGIREIAEATPA